MMRYLSASVLLVAISTLDVALAKSWSFQDGLVSVKGKGVGVGGGFTKEKFTPSAPVSAQLQLGSADTLTVQVTTLDGNEAKRAHQAFLTLREQASGLEESFPLSVKGSGKGRVEITQKDLPIQLLTAGQPLKASLIIGSFGTSTAMNKPAFDITIDRDPSVPIQIPEKPVRYGKLPEIHHIFRADPKSPPAIITLFFVGVACFALPLLGGWWTGMGANFNYLSHAFSTAPIAHGLFFGSILALEGVFVLYYFTWTLFQMLPAATILGLVAFVSGSRALTEVQDRKVLGNR